ncbi:MAG: Cof-type HAD-IIB family hydrolase [Acholeplasmataceae bacterium]|nr:Cof-type HAD-IIB family hydrolase [Acholeplasmataceae bacterium]
MQPYLIACDLDGSLLNKKSDLSPYTIDVLSHLSRLGHKVVIATGRPFGGAIDLYYKLGINAPMINDNGATIENPMDSKFAKQRTLIPNDIMKDIFTHAKPILKSAFFSIKKTVYAYKYEPKLEEYFAGLATSSNVIECEFTDLDVEPSGLIFLVDTHKKEILENYIKENYNQTISFRLWGAGHKHAIYEIYLKHVSKSSALSYLLDYYNMDQSQLIAFGDGINDIEMIRDAGIGVMMKNGNWELKGVSKDQTKFTNDEDGIARYLVNFFDLNEHFK